MKQLNVLAIAFLLFTSCNGQIKTTASTNDAGEQKPITNKQPKLIKTQGSDQYQNVHCGLQDKAGNLWFGTTGEGVYVYDGKLFTQFTKKDGLSSNAIWAISEDRTGNIWFGTASGICRYDGKTITAVPITIAGNLLNNALPSKNAVWSTMVDRGGKIWFGTDDGLYCSDGKTFTRFIDDKSIENKSGLTLKNVQCMYEDSSGNMWFGSGPMAQEGIIRYDGKFLENWKPQNEGWIRNITQDKKGDILFATRHHGACSYNGKNFTFISNSLGVVYNSMMISFEDKAGNLWFASDYGTELNDSVGGAWRYDGKTLTKFSTKDGLANNAVFLILEDRSGNIWIGTRNNGLYCFDGKNLTSFTEQK
jgi:streptogramin lyase